MVRRSAAEESREAAVVAGKGRATPSRREQEAARRQPIVASDRRAARRASRSREAERRERARIGMANGEERYLPVRDRGPQRRYVRDVLDSQWTFGEFLIPVIVVFFVATLVLPQQAWLFLPLYGFLAVAVVDGLIRAAVIRRRLTARYGRAQVQRGLNFYVVMRSLQLRALRVPKPQVARGTKVSAG